MKSAEEPFDTIKERGEWAEMRFMARAAEHGFRVSKPWGESSRYDFAVEANGRFLRIQVKSTVYRSRSGRGYTCAIQPPRSPHVDAIPANKWISSRLTSFPRTSGTFCQPKLWSACHTRIQLSPNCKDHRYAPYKEAWHLLDEAVAKKDESAPPASPEPASPENEISVPPSVADPDAEPGEIALLRGAVEIAPAVGFDHDLLRSRMMGCFERMKRR